MNDPWRMDAEAYVLGALDDDERRAFEDHVRGCADCLAAVAEVGALPALLDLVPAELVDRLAAHDPVTAGAVRPRLAQVPPSLLVGLLAAARRRTARRRRRVLAGALGALAAAVVALVLLVPTSPLSVAPEPAPAAGVQLTLRALSPTPITASARLEPVAWGTRMELTCTYTTSTMPGDASGYGYGADEYALVVIDDAGTAEQVATWTAVPDATITVPASSHLPVSRIAAIQLRAPDGTPLLTASP